MLIDNDIKYTDGAHNIVPYDIDGDGKIELIANSYRSDALILYKYDGDPHNPLNWTRYVIDSSVGAGNSRRPVIMFIKSTVKEKLLGGFTSGAHYTAIADLDGDGRDDLVVACDSKHYDIVWYETPESITDTSAWQKHALYQNDSHRTYHVEAGDIDGDGDMDIVFATKTDNSLGWLENNGSLINWPMAWLDNNCIRCFNARVADLDKDGNTDVIATNDETTNGSKLYFYNYSENSKNKSNWNRYVIGNFSCAVSVFEIRDMDDDNDLDILVGGYPQGFYLLKNPYPSNVGREWGKYIICPDCYPREIDVGDIDRDGDLDVVTAEQRQNAVFLFENNGTTFYCGWEKHIVDKSDKYLNWCHHIELSDIDGDGDLDIAVAAAGSNTFLYYYANI